MTTDQGSSIGHVPAKEKWEFDRSVTSVFDDMISRSIPSYNAMREIVYEFAVPFLVSDPNKKGRLLDLGCSTGLGIQQFGTLADEIVGVEIAPSMLEAARQRFENYANVRILKLDLRRQFPSGGGWDVVFAIFTLQFLPVEHRRGLIEKVFSTMREGGAFFVAEKTIAQSGAAQELMRGAYHEFKRRQGYSAEEVERKALALEGVLVAQTAAENEAMLRAAGFRHVEPIWRHGCFAAWIAMK